MPSDQPRVLVVEDEKSTRVLFRHALGDLGDLTVVEDEDASLEAVDSEGFDLLLPDINLNAEDSATLSPDRGGVELLHAFPEREDMNGVPAVAVTAYAMPGDRERLLAEGFDRYVGKPFTVGELREAVDEMLPES